MRNTFLITLLILCTTGYAQSFTSKSVNNEKQTIFKTLSAGEVENMTINVSSYNETSITELSEALKRYPGKVFNVQFNTQLSTLKFTYNEFMLKQDLIRAFDEHNIQVDLSKEINHQRIK